MILLISRNDDQSTEDIIDWLYHFGVSFERMNGEEFLASKKKFSWTLQSDEQPSTHYESIDFNQYSAFLFRRWVNADTGFQEALAEHSALQLNSLANMKAHLNTEMRKASNSIFQALATANVKSIPKIGRKSFSKQDTLQLAFDLGIKVPDSLLCNNKADLMIFHEKHGTIITKPMSEVITLYAKNYRLFTRTSIVSTQILEEMEDLFFPSFFQQYIEKEVEIRSFFLEEAFYSMAIFSQNDEQTKVDFRNYNNEKPNRTIPFKLPEWLELKLLRLMKKLELNTGSVDLILTPEGEFYFLEVNPVGQFGMTSYPCNYFLEKKIVQALLQPAS